MTRHSHRLTFRCMRQKELTEAAELAMREGASVLTDLDKRSREIFRQIVQSYISTGDPAGSRNISRALPMTLSPASVRNIMSDLEELGLIYAPHTSAGRLPTETGLRLFVDALLETGNLSGAERSHIKSQLTGGAGERGRKAREVGGVACDHGAPRTAAANCCTSHTKQ